MSSQTMPVYYGRECKKEPAMPAPSCLTDINQVLNNWDEEGSVGFLAHLDRQFFDVADD